MGGYGWTIFDEVSDQLQERGDTRGGHVQQITHLVLCAGVGSFASSGAMYCYHKTQESSAVWSPNLQFLVVEPNDAACLLENVKRFKATETTDPSSFELAKCSGKTESLMAGLNCGVPSTTAFPILRDLTDVFISVSDVHAKRAVRTMHNSGLVVGESGAAGLAGILALGEIGKVDDILDENSTVLFVSTEADTDIDVWRSIVEGDLVGSKL